MASVDPAGKPYDLDGQLEICIEEFVEDRENYWKLRTDGADWQNQLFGHAERVADILLKRTIELVQGEPLRAEGEQFLLEHRKYFDEIRKEFESLFKLVEPKLRGEPELGAAGRQAIENILLDRSPEDGSLLKVVWERLCIHVANDAIKGIVGGANRILQLSQLFLDTTPPIETIRFLRRVSRCYIWGLDAECAMLCRGAIDTAFQKRVPDKLCKDCGFKKKSYGYTLSQRIKAASRKRVIRRRIRRVALDGINEPATRAQHENPETIADAFAIVKNTCDVLNALFASQKRSA